MTRRDAADVAGTSPSVVSYVLNSGPRTVAPDTRRRVLEAVEQLGYRPNGIARSLRMNRTMTFGLVVPDNANPFFAELARAVEEAAFAAGYTLLVGNPTADEARQTTYVRTFLDRQVDGLVLIPSHAPVACLLDLQRSKVPWVVLDRLLPEPLMASQVTVDNRGGAYQATRHLLEHGHRRTACIAGPTDVAPTADRMAGWRAALAEAGLPAAETLSRHMPFGRYEGYRAALELLRDERVDAVFAASDEQALGVLRAAAELRLSCPGQLALASFDGIPASAYAVPALTTMRQPFGQLGEAVVAVLTDLLANPVREPITVVLPVDLVARGSCGCPDPPVGMAATLGAGP